MFRIRNWIIRQDDPRNSNTVERDNDDSRLSHTESVKSIDFPFVHSFDRILRRRAVDDSVVSLRLFSDRHAIGHADERRACYAHGSRLRRDEQA